MKRLLLTLCLLGAVGALSAEDAPKGAPSGRRVLEPARRIDALKLATHVLETRESTWKSTTKDLPDPFFRTNFAKGAEEEQVKPDEVKRTERTDLEVLELAAADIRPTGSMMVDGENYLLLGGKRYKKGAVLSVTVDGIVYEITISAIEGKSYTLRLNEQELRRLLK